MAFSSIYIFIIIFISIYNWYAEYIMGNAGLDESQARIKISRRNTNNLRYADDSTLMAENKEGLKSLLMKVKEESEKAGLKLTIQKIKIKASNLITPWQKDAVNVETVAEFISWTPKSLWIVTEATKPKKKKKKKKKKNKKKKQTKKTLAPWKKSYDKHRQHIKKQTLLCWQRSI